MTYTEALTRYTANFIDELAVNGLQDVVISPGSRSTPLAVLFAEHERIKDWIVVDERSAAYFALGIAQAKKRPVALVCTSGTAAANYLPAVVEAFHARVPLLVLTADRPHELRDIGASQTINQMGMYHHFVKLFYEMAPPSQEESVLSYVRNRALRSYQTAALDNPGPVHVNFPFHEPLMPDIHLHDLWSQVSLEEEPKLYSGKKTLSLERLAGLRKFIQARPNGLLVCGPQIDPHLAEALPELSRHLQVPLLVDPLSQIRTGKHINDTVIASYDTIFRSERIRKQLKPDYIIRFGAMPISKHYSFFIKEHAAVPQFVVEGHDQVREPSNHDSRYIIADPAFLCRDLMEKGTEREASVWMDTWRHFDGIVKEALQAASSEQLTEGTTVRTVIEQLKDQDFLFIANSMPIRDVDTFLMPRSKSITTYANRGVSGIDGTTSTALGVAASGRPVTLIIGDLSFYHDLNSLLLAKRYHLPITIILINNNGGGIFSFLPQAKEEKHFEHLFGTPLDLEFEAAVRMFGGNYHQASNEKELEESYAMSRSSDRFSVIEVKTDRTQNLAWHRELWADIQARLEADGG